MNGSELTSTSASFIERVRMLATCVAGLEGLEGFLRPVFNTGLGL